MLTLKFNITLCSQAGASAQHCIDCNDCELSHSDGKKTSELNKEQIKEIMQTGSTAITGLNNSHTGFKSVISNSPDEMNRMD